MASSSEIRAVLFDYGGVLAEEGFFNGLRRLGREQGLSNADELPRIGLDVVYETGYVTGRGSEAAFWEQMRRRTGLRGGDAELRWPILEGFVLRPGMLALVRELREAGYRVGLLSDQTDWLDRLDERDHFYQAFDDLFISYRLGMGKRDEVLFDQVAQTLGLPPAAILFIDDNPGNVERARRHGWQAIRFTNEESLRGQLAELLGLSPHPNSIE
ncbi:MAG: HAD family phosphatase [Gammaproteobacteria bacterium]|nr:MAG: HAD family phosphatase [Gammaproteobacteria bacterium]